jgi:hypothetical protein
LLEIEEQATNEEDDVSAEIQVWFEDYQRKLRAEERDGVSHWAARPPSNGNTELGRRALSRDEHRPR